jgi:hypothetical protein
MINEKREEWESVARKGSVLRGPYSEGVSMKSVLRLQRKRRDVTD